MQHWDRTLDPIPLSPCRVDRELLHESWPDGNTRGQDTSSTYLEWLARTEVTDELYGDNLVTRQETAELAVTQFFTKAFWTLWEDQVMVHGANPATAKAD